MTGMLKLRVVSVFNEKHALENLMNEFGFNNVSARMLLAGTPFVLEKEKHALVDKFNETWGHNVLVKLEPLEESNES